MRAPLLLAENIRALLNAQHKSQVDLARAFNPARTRGWINKILNGARAMQLEDFDVVADFFHVTSQQLLQPGISTRTENRITDRRLRPDRRHSDSERELRKTQAELARVGMPGHRERSGHLVAVSSVDSRREAIDRIITDATRQLAPLLREENAGGQAPVVSLAKSKSTRRDRAVRRQDHPVAPAVKGAKR